MDWKPKHAKRGISNAILGVTICFKTEYTFFQTLAFVVSLCVVSAAGFKPNNTTEPKTLTAIDESSIHD